MPTLQEVSAQMPELKATKRVNPKIGAMADFLKYLKSAESTQQMQGLMSVLPFVDDLETVLDRVSYGEPLTTGKGMTTALSAEMLKALAQGDAKPSTRSKGCWHPDPRAAISKQKRPDSSRKGSSHQI
jgi:hypothetical protein